MDIGCRRPPVEYDASEMDAASTPLLRISGSLKSPGPLMTTVVTFLLPRRAGFFGGVHLADHVQNNPERLFINFVKSQHQSSYFLKWETQNISFIGIFW